MTKAMASMDATVTVGLMSLMAMDLRTEMKSESRILQKMAERIAANMQDVPEAENQLRLKMAAYLAGLETTGGMRRMWLCRPGQGRATVALLRRATMG